MPQWIASSFSSVGGAISFSQFGRKAVETCFITRRSVTGRDPCDRHGFPHKVMKRCGWRTLSLATMAPVGHPLRARAVLIEPCHMRTPSHLHVTSLGLRHGAVVVKRVGLLEKVRNGDNVVG